MGKIVKNYVYNLMYQLLALFIPLVTAPYLARVLGAANVGAYSYINSTSILLTTIFSLGIYGYGNRQIAYVRDDKKKIDKVFWELISTRLVMCLLGSLVYFGIVIAINRYVGLFIIYYLYFIAYFLDSTWLYVGVEDMKWAVLKNIITKAIAVLGIFTFVKSEYDLWIYVLIQSVSILFSNLLAFTQVFKYVGRPKFILTNFKEHVKQSALLFLPSVASLIYMQCDKVMIELITLDSAQVSFYDYSEKLVMIPLTFITVLSTVMMPRIANEYVKGNSSNISELLNNAARFSVFMACPMLFGLVALSGKLIPWYLGNEFLVIYPAIVIISPIILTNTIVGITGTQYFTATNQIKILIKAEVSAAILNVVINAILIPIYGFKGAAIATVLTSGLNAMIQYYHLIKQVRMFGFIKYLLQHIFIAIVMYAVIIVCTNKLDASPFTNLIQITIGVVTYLTITLVIKDKGLYEMINVISKKIVRKCSD